jgi:hypothetical protein
MALKFNGTTQYVDCGNGTSLQITGDVSVSAWLMVEQDWVPSHYQYHNVAVKGSVFNLGYGLIVYERQIDTKTHPQFFVKNSSGHVTTGLDFYVPNNWGVNNWVHLVGTFSSSAGRIRLYEAGVMVAEVSTTLYPSSTSDRFYIARPADSYNTNDVFFTGYIADVRVYNRELTPEEVAEIYHHRGADKVWQGLVGWWRLDDLPSGTPAPLLLDAMDSTTGWSVSLSDSISLNTTTYQEGSGAINFIKGATVRTYSWMYKTITSVNVTGQTIKLWIYIKDQTTLNKISSVHVRLYSTYDTDAKLGGISNADLAVGWNLFSKHINDFDNMGTPDITAITTLRVQVNTNNASDTISEGNLIYDFYRAGDYVPNSIIDLSGNGNHGTPYNSPDYQASPHRLRRGVLVS